MGQLTFGARQVTAALALVLLFAAAQGRVLQQFRGQGQWRGRGWGSRQGGGRGHWRKKQQYYASQPTWNSYMNDRSSSGDTWTQGRGWQADGSSSSSSGGGGGWRSDGGASSDNRRISPSRWRSSSSSSSSTTTTTRGARGDGWTPDATPPSSPATTATTTTTATQDESTTTPTITADPNAGPPTPTTTPTITADPTPTLAEAATATTPTTIPTLPLPSPTPSPSSGPPSQPDPASTYVDLTPLIPLYALSPPAGNLSDPLLLSPEDAAATTIEQHNEEDRCKGYVNANAFASSPGGATQLDMEYRGGPVLDTMAVHLIFIGRSWLSGSAVANTTMAASVFFTANLNSLPWWEINRYYPEGANSYRTPQCAVQLVETKVHAVPDTSILTEVDLVNQIKDYIVNDIVDFYPRRSSYVFMLPDLKGQQFTKINGLSSCTHFCAFHNYVTAVIPGYGKQRIPYAVVSNPLSCGSDLGFCAQKDIAANPSAAPNGIVADPMISFLAHELAEICTDPYFTSWYDDAGLENADKCVRDFGDIQTTAGGKLYNMYVGGKPFLVQSNWHLPTRRCQLSP